MRNLIAFAFLVLSSGFALAQDDNKSYITEMDKNKENVKSLTTSNSETPEASNDDKSGIFIDANNFENIELDATIVASSSKNLKMVYIASNLFYIHNYALA